MSVKVADCFLHHSVDISVLALTSDSKSFFYKFYMVIKSNKTIKEATLSSLQCEERSHSDSHHAAPGH